MNQEGKEQQWYKIIPTKVVINQSTKNDNNTTAKVSNITSRGPEYANKLYKFWDKN